MKKPRKKHWSLMVEERGVRVRVYERPGTENLTREVRMPDGTKDRRSLGHGDRTLAEQQVRALARELARAELTGADVGTLSIGQLFAAYFHPRHGKLLDRAAWKQAARTRANLFMEAWGPDLPVRDLSQGHVDRYAAARRAGTLSPLGDGGRGDRTPVRVRDGTIDGDFRWLSSAFNWARRHKVDGRRLLSENPLHDLRWPKEANVRRPVASHERFLRTRKVVDRVDPQGRLRCILALARYTGRREAAICGLKASDLLLSVGRVQEALAAAGMDERIGEHMPHGAIRWAAESDKQGLLHITPISQAAREALDHYLLSHPMVGDVPLFPAPKDPTVSIRRDTVSTWLLRAEKAAGLPKLVGGVFHPYRRLWATERKSLPDADVAAAGGWKDTRALKLSYQQADPATLLRVVEGGR